MSSVWADPPRAGPQDHMERLPDSILLLVLNFLSDVKSLGRLSAVSRRFRLLVPQVDSVLVRIDCVLSSNTDSPSSGNKMRAPHPLSNLLRLVIAPFLALLRPRAGAGGGGERGGVTHHSPAHVLRDFREVKNLRIDLPAGELGVEDGVLLKWRAHFGSTLDNCVILGASSVTKPTLGSVVASNEDNDDSGSIPESFYTNGGLKLRVVWTISSLIAASARHYLLQPIIADHKTLTSLILTDADNQGVLCMDREQLEELRVKPLSASSASKRTLVPALNMRLWYAQCLELPDGRVMKGATLVAIRPSGEQQGGGRKEAPGAGDAAWVSGAFEEPFGTAARMLVKRRTYCLEMNSF